MSRQVGNLKPIELSTEEVDELNAIEMVTPFRACTPAGTGTGISNGNKMHILFRYVVTRAYNLGEDVMFVIFILCARPNQQSYIEVQKLKCDIHRTGEWC